jgi:hypothetical protein
LVLDSTILENIPMESNHQLNWNITLSDVPTFSNVLAIQRRPEFRRPNEFCHSVEGNRHTLLSALGLPLVSFPTAPACTVGETRGASNGEICSPSSAGQPTHRCQ